MKPLYTVTRINAQIVQQRLYVQASLGQVGGDTEIEAYLPARETAALLPREILIGKGSGAPETILDIMNELLEKLASGRTVKIWEYQGKIYFSFLKWNTLRIGDPAA